MASDDPGGRNGDLSPRDDFFTPASRFDFFQLVKLLEQRVRRRRQSGDGDADGSVESVGASEDPSREALRFHSTLSMAFPSSDIGQLELEAGDDDRSHLTVNFIGLSGAHGPLPYHYTEIIKDRLRHDDPAMRDFFDIFNHRLVSLMYQARARNAPAVFGGAYDTHPFAQHLLAFAGLGEPGAVRAFDDAALGVAATGSRGELKARELIRYAGLLWSRERSMTGLCTLLRYHFGFADGGRIVDGRWRSAPPPESRPTTSVGRKTGLVETRLRGHALQARVYELGTEERTALSTRERHNRLGHSTVLGGRVWDPQAGFDLELSPLGWDDFLDFLPTGPRCRALRGLTDFYTRSAYDVRLRLVVAADEIRARQPVLRPIDGPRLGWTSWLVTDDRALAGAAGAEVDAPAYEASRPERLRALEASRARLADRFYANAAPIVHVDAAPAPAPAPLAVAIVIETSAPMSGAKLGLARRTVGRLLQTLPDGDVVSIFGIRGDEVEELWAPTPLTDEVRRGAGLALETPIGRGMVPDDAAIESAMGRARRAVRAVDCPERRVLWLVDSELPLDAATLEMDRPTPAEETLDEPLPSFATDDDRVVLSLASTGGGPGHGALYARLEDRAWASGGGLFSIGSEDNIDALAIRIAARSAHSGSAEPADGGP